MALALRDIAMERNRVHPRCVLAGNCAALDLDALGPCNRGRSCGGLIAPKKVILSPGDPASLAFDKKRYGHLRWEAALRSPFVLNELGRRSPGRSGNNRQRRLGTPHLFKDRKSHAR